MPAWDPRRLAGDLAFYDDGWRAALAVSRRPDGPAGGLGSRFVSHERTVGSFPSTLTVGPDPPHAVRLAVTGFNELDRQDYQGYASTRGPLAVTGVTWWKGLPFGFLAVPRPPRSIGAPRPGPLLPGDVAGEYLLRCDGLRAHLTLAATGDGDRPPAVEGVLVDVDGSRLPVTGRVGPDVPHQVSLTVEHAPGGSAPVLTLWMFVRARSILAGWVDWGNARLSCHLSRTAWAPGPAGGRR